MKSFCTGTLALILLSFGMAWADSVKPADNGALIDLKKDSSNMITENNGATGKPDTEAGAIKITIPAGKGYPGITISSPDGPWNLTGYTGIDAEITNTGTSSLQVNLRIDGDDDWKNQTWNCQNSTIAPGETQTIHVTFGMSYGQPGYKMPLDHVLRALIFVADPEAAGTLKLISLKASK